MFDRLDMGSAQTYYWLLQSLVGLREINNEGGRAAAYLFKRYTTGVRYISYLNNTQKRLLVS